MQQMTKDLKDEIKAANKSQTEEMQRMTKDLKEEIKAVNENQTQEMTEGFKKELHSRKEDSGKKNKQRVTRGTGG